MRILGCTVGVLLAASVWLPAAAETRVALVIGNGGYPASGMALANPPRDARAVAAALRDLGFATDEVLDAGREAMEDAIVRFVRGARDADVALFFYAGHGLQDLGRNYLMPVDAKLEDETDLRRRFVRLDDVLEDLAGTRAARIVVLDACRDNAAVEALRAAVPKSRSASVSRGLAAVPKTAGMLVAFATQPNRVAADGEPGNSPFTKALVQHLGTPGVELRTALTRVRVDVARATGDAQVPEVSDSLLGEIYLRPAAVATVTAPPAPLQQPEPKANPAPPPTPRSTDTSEWDKENALWNAAQSIGSLEAYEAYLRAYPKGHFVAIAEVAIAAKRKLAPTPPQVAPQPPAPQTFAALPPAPLAPPPPSLESQARLFVDRMNLDWSRDDGTALAAAAQGYGTSVVFYGKTLGRDAILADKQKFLERWPVRSYRARADSIRIACSESARSCTISGLVDYSVANPATRRRAGGLTSFAYELSFARGAPQIVAEAGEVVQRN